MADPNDERMRFARKLATSSVVVRAIGIAVMVGSVIGLLAALSLRRSDDRVGFSLMSMAVLVLGALVWGSGVFHAAVSRFLPTVLDIEDKLDGAVRPRKARRAAHAGVERPEEPASPGDVLALAETLPPGDASPGMDALAQASATSTVPEPLTAAAASEEAPPDQESEPRIIRRSEEPEPARVPCPHCSGRIHPDASRCVHCMRRVERHTAAPS